MKEYIEREAELKEVDNADVMCDIPPDAYRVLRRYIERIPAADVVPVVRGEVETLDRKCGNPLFHLRQLRFWLVRRTQLLPQLRRENGR